MIQLYNSLSICMSIFKTIVSVYEVRDLAFAVTLSS